MTARRGIPVQLGPVFAVHDATAIGVGEHRLEASDLRSPFHGTRARSALPASFELDCAALATRFRHGDAFTGPTAARLYGMPLPPAIEADRRLYVSSLDPARSLRRRGVVGSTRAREDSTTRHGVPVLQVWETCLALASTLGTYDLTAVIDFAVTGVLGRYPLSSLDDLLDFVASNASRPGIASLRTASGLARKGAWSRPETWLRLTVGKAGLPEPELNGPLVHPSGRELIPDLGWPIYRVAAEYNGGHHDHPDQRVHDLRRMDDFTDIGWSTVNIEKVELFQTPNSAVARVAQRLRMRGWVPEAARWVAKIR